MQNASSLDVEENGRGQYLSRADSLWELFVGLENIRLTSIYPRSAVVFAQGQSPEGVYLLRAGRAKVSLSSAQGKTIILRVVQAGAVLGVNSVLKDVPYDVSVETLERSRIDFVSRSDFMRVLEKSESTRPGVAHLLADELSDMVEQLRSLLLSQSAAEKLARLLLRWSDQQVDTARAESRLNLGLTHEEIAQMICASRETVTRLFAELRRKQIVRFANGTIVVRDRNALELLARYREISETSSA